MNLLYKVDCQQDIINNVIIKILYYIIYIIWLILELNMIVAIILMNVI